MRQTTKILLVCVGLVAPALSALAATYDLSPYDVWMSTTIWTETSTPSTPPSGKVAVYAKATGELCSIADTSTEVCMSAGSGGGGGDNSLVNGVAMTDMDVLDSTWIDAVRGAVNPDTLTLNIIAASIGSTQVAALDTADVTTGTWVDARVDGSLEADELTLVGDVDGVANANDLDEASVEVELEGVLDLADLQGTLGDAKLTSNYSGVGVCGTDTWASTLSDNAVPTCTQPAFSNLSGAAVDGQVPNNITVDLSTEATNLVVGNELNLLSNNCILENDATPIPDSCIGDGSDSGGGGGGNAVEVSIALTSIGTYFSATVTSQAWVTATSKILCEPFGTTADGLTAETIAVAAPRAVVANRVVGVGFDVLVSSPYGLEGTVRFQCIGV